MRPILPEEPRCFERLLMRLHPLLKRLPWCASSGDDEGTVPHPSSMRRRHNWWYRLVIPAGVKRVTVDDEAIADLKSRAEGHTLVYVAKLMGQLEYHALNERFLREGLPLVAYTNALTARRWLRWGDFWKSIRAQEGEIAERSRPVAPAFDGTLKRMVVTGESVLVQIPPSSLEEETGVATLPLQALAAIVRAQRESERPISIVPVDFLWSRRPARQERSLVDILFGEKEAPGALRRAALFLRKFHKSARVILGRTIDLPAFVAAGTERSDEDLALNLRGMLQEGLSAQRRTVTGPPLHPRGWTVRDILADEELDNRICRIAAERCKPADDLRDLAKRYAQQIAADIDATYIEVVDRVLTHAFGRLYDDFDVDTAGLERARALYAEGPIVFVPNHKSHVDYLLLSHILYHRHMTVPLIAAGDNMNFWPLGKIFRHCGAYFIRRSFRDNPLYKAVLETYLKLLLVEGYSQVFFIEGGRSRTGKLAPPRMGMFSMLERAAAQAGLPAPVYIPVAITYDRVIEEKSFVRELEGGEKERERTGHVLKLTKFLRRQKRRYGSITVRFGEPIPATPAATEEVERARKVEATAYEVCHRINQRTVVTPTALAAAAIMAEPRRGVTLADFRWRAELLLEYLRVKEVELSHRFERSTDRALADALTTLAEGKLIALRQESVEPFLAVDEGRRVQLAIVKNGAVHFFVTVSVVATLLRKHPQGTTVRDGTEHLDLARALLAHEFRFATSHAVQEHAQHALDFLRDAGAVESAVEGYRVTPAGGHALDVLAGQIIPFLETLAVALAAAATWQEGERDEHTLVAEMQATGNDLLLLERIRHREAITKDGLRNALRALVSYGILEVGKPEPESKRKTIYRPTQDAHALATLHGALERFL